MSGAEKGAANSLGSFPRAIIQLINKNDPDGFQPQDLEYLEYLTKLVGRCHDCILKIEQLHFAENVSAELMRHTDAIANSVDDSVAHYAQMKKPLRDFLDRDER